LKKNKRGGSDYRANYQLPFLLGEKIPKGLEEGSRRWGRTEARRKKGVSLGKKGPNRPGGKVMEKLRRLEEGGGKKE